MNQALKNKACIFDTCKMSGVQKFNKCTSIRWKKNMWNGDGASTDTCLWKVIPPTLKYPYYPVSWRRASCVARRYEVRRGFLPADYRWKYLCTFIGVSRVYWAAQCTASGENSSVTLWSLLANHPPVFLSLTAFINVLPLAALWSIFRFVALVVGTMIWTRGLVLMEHS